MMWILFGIFVAVLAIGTDMLDEQKRRNERDMWAQQPMSRDEEKRQRAMEFWGTDPCPDRKPRVGEHGPLGKRIV